jgi:hypothetical protein
MQSSTSDIPKTVIKSIGGGLLLMAVFTMMWAGIAQSGLTSVGRIAIIAVFSCLSLVFIVYAVYLFIMSRHFPALKSEADKAEGKKIGKWYGIIFGAEGITIPIVVFTLLHFQQDKLVVPAIALVVGLHFYPMAKVFKRNIDYYLATWTCLVAISAILFIFYSALPQATIVALLGVCVGMATSSYGFYMIYEGNRMTKSS